MVFAVGVYVYNDIDLTALFWSYLFVRTIISQNVLKKSRKIILRRNSGILKMRMDE